MTRLALLGMAAVSLSGCGNPSGEWVGSYEIKESGTISRTPGAEKFRLDLRKDGTAELLSGTAATWKVEGEEIVVTETKPGMISFLNSAGGEPNPTVARFKIDRASRTLTWTLKGAKLVATPATAR